MKLDIADFRVPEGSKVRLDQWPTRVKPVCKTNAAYLTLLADHVAQLSALQQLLYAANSHAVLLIF